MSIDFSVIIPFVWLNPWAGKMKWIVCCYLRLLEGQDGPIWTTRSFLHWSNKKEFPFWPYNKSFIDQANVCSRWLDVGLVLFCIFTDLNLSRFFLRGGGHLYTGYMWNLQSCQRLESGIQYIRNPQHGIQTPIMFCLTLQGVTCFASELVRLLSQ